MDKRIIIINTVIFLMLIICSVLFQSSRNYVLEKLPSEEQMLLMAGCSTDCKEQENGCNEDIITCNKDSDCADLIGVGVCMDDTMEELCEPVLSSWFECVKDDDHTCSPKYTYTGYCDLQTTQKCSPSVPE